MCGDVEDPIQVPRIWFVFWSSRPPRVSKLRLHTIFLAHQVCQDLQHRPLPLKKTNGVQAQLSIAAAFLSVYLRPFNLRFSVHLTVVSLAASWPRPKSTLVQQEKHWTTQLTLSHITSLSESCDPDQVYSLFPLFTLVEATARSGTNEGGRSPKAS